MIFNPPNGALVTDDYFYEAFDRLEKKLGLVGQPRYPYFHDKHGERHAHCVWSRIDIDRMKAINMAFFKEKCTQLSRELFLENEGWDIPAGLIDKQEKDPFDVFIGEFRQLLKVGIDPVEVKQCCQDAWHSSVSSHGFKEALEERGLFLAQGDKRGFVVIDQNRKVYSLSRYGGLKTKDLKARLGRADQLPTVRDTKNRIRSIFNADIRHRTDLLKKQHAQQMQPFLDRKSHLVSTQRAERRELEDQQRIKRNIKANAFKDRFHRGEVEPFDRAIGRKRRVRLIKRGETELIRREHKEGKQLMIFRHNRARAELQKSIKQLRDCQLQERLILSKQIYGLREMQEVEQRYSARPDFHEVQDRDASALKPAPVSERRRSRNHIQKMSHE